MVSCAVISRRRPTPRTCDAFALRRLAALDDRPALRGQILLAEQAGEIHAALSIDTDRVVANPFAATADLVDMLRVHRRYTETVAA